MTRPLQPATSQYSAGTSHRQPALPPLVLPASVLAFLTIGWGPNMPLAGGSLLVLLLGCALLWRPGETPILLYAFAIQWLEASLAIFYANLFGENIDWASTYGANMQFATALSLVGLLVLAVGMRLAAGPPRAIDAHIARTQAVRIPQQTWFALYIAAFLVATCAQMLAREIPGLSQPLLVLANFKWAAFVILTYVSFVRLDAKRKLWLIVFLTELFLSIGGYFSSFKFVFIYTFIGVVAAGIRFSFSQILGLAALGAVAVFFGTAWTAIKVDYRAFVSGGETAQIVTVDRIQQVGIIIELLSDLDASGLQDGLDRLARRVTYVEFFGVATNYVPRVAPYEEGALWLDAITRPFMPRLFFPDKEIIDESALTNKYTRLSVAGAMQGTQISIGYLGESYIDFGPYGMMAALFALGLFLGRIYAWLVKGRNSRGVLGMGLASMLLIPVGAIGNSSAKMFGSIVVSLLVVWLLNRFVVPKFLPWLRA